MYVTLALAYSAAMTESGSSPITGTGVVVMFWELVADDELTKGPPEVRGVVPVMFPDPWTIVFDWP